MISIVIPTYKNRSQLIENITKNLPFIKGCEVIVVNDNPTDDLTADLQPYPYVVLLQNSHNLGFAGSVNKGISHAKYPYVMLLNSDVVLKDNSYIQVLHHFKTHNNLFAVSFAQEEKNGETVGGNIFFWERGMFLHEGKKYSTLHKNGWAEGGSCIIDREKFLQLGGFDTMYAPFYWEDIDLSYRAWKRTYHILFEPAVLVEHHHESTIGKYFNRAKIKTTAYRNQFLFTWKNITDLPLLVDHMLWLPLHLLLFLIRGEFFFLLGFLHALGKIRTVIIKRKQEQLSSKLSDKEIIDKLHE